MTNPNHLLNTVAVSPVDLVVGDQVVYYGALLQVEHVTVRGPEGNEVHANTSRLIGEECGAIPRSWFDTPESLVRSGCTWAKDLPEGLYTNVQGNHLASCRKVIKE